MMIFRAERIVILYDILELDEYAVTMKSYP